jgi:hypothetical protein
VLSRRGELAKANADFQDAIHAYQLVLEDRQAWPDAARQSPATVFDYGATLAESAGVMVRMGRVLEGLALYRMGVELLEGLLDFRGASDLAREYPDRLAGIAEVYLGLPQLRKQIGKSATAPLREASIESCQKALNLIRLVGSVQGSEQGAEYHLFWCHAKLSELQFDSGRRDEAFAEVLRAIPYLRSVVERPDALRDFSVQRWIPLLECVPVWIKLADWFSRAGDTGPGRQLLEAVLALFGPCLTVIEDDPRHASLRDVLRRDLAVAHNTRASCNSPDS